MKDVLRRMLPERVIRAGQILVRGYAGMRWTYNLDGLATVHSARAVSEPEFSAAYEKGLAAGSWPGADPRWRVYLACWCARQALKLSGGGDFVECGVNTGGTSRAVMEIIHFNDTGRSFFLLDTYCGFDDQLLSPVERDSVAAHFSYHDSYERAKETFRPFPKAILVKGSVPATLAQVATDRVCYLHLDMNCAAPEVAAAEYFWERLVPGAAILLDDYGFEAHAEQRLAFDSFARRHDVPLLSLPTGQGLLFKPA